METLLKKIKNKHITSFLDPLPGSVTHFTSFERIEGEGVLAPQGQTITTINYFSEHKKDKENFIF